MCDSCEVLYINGVKCHETGCPESWKDAVRECKWCGTKFRPIESNQHFCSEECGQDYNM